MKEKKKDIVKETPHPKKNISIISGILVSFSAGFVECVLICAGISLISRGNNARTIGILCLISALILIVELAYQIIKEVRNFTTGKSRSIPPHD